MVNGRNERVTAAQRPQGLAVTRRSGWHPHAIPVSGNVFAGPAQRRAICMLRALVSLYVDRERFRAAPSVFVEQAAARPWLTASGDSRSAKPAST